MDRSCWHNIPIRYSFYLGDCGEMLDEHALIDGAEQAHAYDEDEAKYDAYVGAADDLEGSNHTHLPKS